MEGKMLFLTLVFVSLIAPCEGWVQLATPWGLTATIYIGCIFIGMILILRRECELQRKRLKEALDIVEASEGARSLCRDSYGGYRYCNNGCCGLYTCCGSTPRTYVRTTSFHSYWSIGYIIPTVIGCLLGLCGLIGMTICCVKAVKACSSRRTGEDTAQTHNQPNVVMMSTGLQSNYPIGQQPYPGQPQPYPAQGYRNPAYPPTQPNLAYPPPFAGNPPPYGFNTEPYLVNPGNNSVQAASESKY